MKKPAKYRKKPVVVEAMRWDGTRPSIEAICRWANDPGPHDDDPIVSYEFNGTSDVQRVFVGTLEGDMRANPGDWIIRGTEGEFYPCKPAAFDGTFEAVAE